MSNAVLDDAEKRVTALKTYIGQCPHGDINCIEAFNAGWKAALEASASADLLAALQELVSEIRAYQSPECDDEGSLSAPLLKQADAAIAKATGAAP